MPGGFMMITRRRAISPYDNPISAWDMDTLLEAAGEAGVDLETVRIRQVETPSGFRSGAATLAHALKSPQVMFVHPEEAAQLAQLLPPAAAGSRDPEFILQMTRFFGLAAKYGGFFVF